MADTGNHAIRRIGPDGSVTTLAGSPRGVVMEGSINGPSSAALFRYPRGVAVDGEGSLYVADLRVYRVEHLLAENDDWGASDRLYRLFEFVGAFPFPSGTPLNRLCSPRWIPAFTPSTWELAAELGSG